MIKKGFRNSEIFPTPSHDIPEVSNWRIYEGPRDFTTWRLVNGHDLLWDSGLWESQRVNIFTPPERRTSEVVKGLEMAPHVER
jgi:hypothetical protein